MADVHLPRDGQRHPPHADQRIAALAAEQAGAISRAQLRALGLGVGAIDDRLQRGWLHPLHRGVYAVGQPTLSRAGHLWGAVLASGAEAALSHRTAADSWACAPAPRRASRSPHPRSAEAAEGW